MLLAGRLRSVDGDEEISATDLALPASAEANFDASEPLISFVKDK